MHFHTCPQMIVAINHAMKKTQTLLRFQPCLHLIVPIHHPMKKYFIDLILIDCIFTLAHLQLIVQETSAMKNKLAKARKMRKPPGTLSLKRLGWVTYKSKKFGPKILTYKKYTMEKDSLGKEIF